MLTASFSTVKNIDLVFPKEHLPLPLSLQAQTKSSLVVMKTEFPLLFSQISPLAPQSLGGAVLQEKVQASLIAT